MSEDIPVADEAEVRSSQELHSAVLLVERLDALQLGLTLHEEIFLQT